MSSLPDRRVVALRIITRLRDIPRHEAALDLAIAAFGSAFDRDRYLAAATSSDPAQLLLAYGVQSGFENLQNHLAGLARDGLELVGSLRPDEPPNSARDLNRLAQLGVVSMARADSMISFQKVRNGLQHAYAEVAPGELYQAVTMLRRDVRGFLADYQRWLKTAVGEPR